MSETTDLSDPGALMPLTIRLPLHWVSSTINNRFSTLCSTYYIAIPDLCDNIKQFFIGGFRNEYMLCVIIIGKVESSEVYKFSTLIIM